jgi:MoxR-like ATPase
METTHNIDPIKINSALLAQLGRSIHGYDYVKERLIIALVADGHVLFRAVPGTGKTTLAKAMQASIKGARCARIQFTPDLMPGDVVGFELFNPREGRFEKRDGPIAGVHILLADEINRTQPKTQAALLEAMQERQVTVGGVTTRLEDPFLVIATQNPIEQEGTYPLPEALLDRFCFLIDLDYATAEDEVAMLGNIQVHGRDSQSAVEAVVSIDEIRQLREMARAVAANASEEAKRYIVSIVRATRPQDPLFTPVKNLRGHSFTDRVTLGASPRAEIWMLHTAAVRALLNGRSYIAPEDIRAVAHDVLRHRIGLNLSYTRTPDDSADSFISGVLRSAAVVSAGEFGKE